MALACRSCGGARFFDDEGSYGLVWFCGPGVLRVVVGGVVPIGARIGWVRASPARCGGALHCSGGTRRRSGRARG